MLRRELINLLIIMALALVFVLALGRGMLVRVIHEGGQTMQIKQPPQTLKVRWERRRDWKRHPPREKCSCCGLCERERCICTAGAKCQRNCKCHQ